MATKKKVTKSTKSTGSSGLGFWDVLGITVGAGLGVAAVVSAAEAKNEERSKLRRQREREEQEREEADELLRRNGFRFRTARSDFSKRPCTTCNTTGQWAGDDCISCQGVGWIYR